MGGPRRTGKGGEDLREEQEHFSRLAGEKGQSAKAGALGLWRRSVRGGTGPGGAEP